MTKSKSRQHLLRTTTALTASFMYISTVSCMAKQLPKSDTLSSESPSTDSLLLKQHADALDVNPMTVMTPADVYRRALATATQDAKLAFLENWITLILESQNTQIVKTVLESSFDIVLPGAIETRAQTSSREFIRNSLTQIYEAIETNPALLNFFPTVPLDQGTAPQMALLGDTTVRPLDPMPYPFGANRPNSLNIRSEGCILSPWPITQVAGDIYSGRKNMQDSVVPCFQENSTALAEQLNFLANNQVKEGPLHQFEVTFSHGSNVPDKISSYEELLSSMQAHGYSFEFYTSRVLVEFLPLFVQQHEKRSSIRAVTWFSIPDGEGRARIPGEHGEIGMLVHKDGKRVAQVRWYGGVPDKTHPGLFAYWRPTLELASPWSGLDYSNVEAFTAGSDHRRALDWLMATSSSMKAFVEFQRKYRPKANSYGIFVCTDSLAVALAKFADIRGKGQRMSQAFPILRPLAGPQEDPAASPSDGLLENAEEIAPGTLRKYYLPDPVLYAESTRADPTNGGISKGFRARLNAAFPPSEQLRLKYFPETLQLLSERIWLSPDEVEAEVSAEKNGSKTP